MGLDVALEREREPLAAFRVVRGMRGGSMDAEVLVVGSVERAGVQYDVEKGSIDFRFCSVYPLNISQTFKARN